MGTFFFIHLAMVYSSFAGFSISTSAPPGPVYSYQLQQEQRKKCHNNKTIWRCSHSWKYHFSLVLERVLSLVNKTKTIQIYYAKNQNRSCWHIWRVFVCFKNTLKVACAPATDPTQSSTKLQPSRMIQSLFWFLLICERKRATASQPTHFIICFLCVCFAMHENSHICFLSAPMGKWTKLLKLNDNLNSIRHTSNASSSI